jgi:signal transduction histidine kinase
VTVRAQHLIGDRVIRPSDARSLQVASVVAAIALTGMILIGALTQNEYRVYWMPFAAEFVVAGVMMGTGLTAWARRPQSRVGLLLVTAGLFHLVWQLTETPWPLTFTLGFLASNISAFLLAHTLLTFPTGRTSSRAERGILLALYAGAAIFVTMRLFIDTTESCPGCPRNLALVAEAPAAEQALLATGSIVLIGASGAIVALFARKWRRGSPAVRRALAPVLAVGAVGGLLGLVEGAWQLWVPSISSEVWMFWTMRLVMVLGSVAFLVGLLRARLSRASVGELVVELGGARAPEEGLRKALARRLGDPSLEIAYFLPKRELYVDEQGHPVALPEEGSARVVTTLESGGETIAALVHDEILRHDPEIVESVAAAARLAIANERLRAEVRAKLEEVRASRTRIVDAADAARRRVERDLHDGAQQRLVRLSLDVGLLREKVEGGPDRELIGDVDAISKQLREALEELRDLARGIHPTILTDEGLLAAVESLAERSPVPVVIEGGFPERLPERVEVTAYFVVAEALTNVARYARASRAVVRVQRRDEQVAIDIVDDGRGGADPAAGSGLRGLEDRLAALGGELRVVSRPGATLVRAEIPLR